MTHRGPFQPLLFCDSVILQLEGLAGGGYLLPVNDGEKDKGGSQFPGG